MLSFPTKGDAMADVSLPRLYLLRAGYLLISAGLAATVWPLLISHPPHWPLMNGVTSSLLAAVSLLAAIGIRHPLQMLPVLLFELAWKAIWLTAVAFPLWLSDRVDAATAGTIRECLLVVVLVPVVPWRHVVSQYVTKPGERWTRAAAAANEGRQR